MRKISLFTLAMLLLMTNGFNALCGNKGFLFFSGRVITSGKPAEQVTVQVIRQKQPITTFTTKSDGFFSVYLDLHSVYEIRLTSHDYNEAVIKLSTALPATAEPGKYEVSGDISLLKRSEKATGYLGYVWFSKQDKKFVLSSQSKPPVVNETKTTDHSSAKNPRDPEKIYNTNEKGAVVSYFEAEKLKQEQIKNNLSVKSEINSALIRSIAESDKKKRSEQVIETCNEEKKEEDNYKKVTSLLLCEGSTKTRLRRVEYKWGSTYYYKNGEQVTEKEFAKAVARSKNQGK